MHLKFKVPQLFTSLSSRFLLEWSWCRTRCSGKSNVRIRRKSCFPTWTKLDLRMCATLLCLLSQLFSNEHHAKPQSGVLADVHHLDCGLFTRSSDWLSHCYNSDWGRVKSNVLIKIKLDVTQYFQAWESDSPVTDQIDLPLQILQGGFLFTFLIFLEWYSPQFLW